MLEGKLKLERFSALLFVPGVLAVLCFVPFYFQSPEMKLASVGFGNITNEYIRGLYGLILYGAAPWGMFCIIISIIQGNMILSRKGIRLIMQKKVFVAYNFIFILSFVWLYRANVMRNKEMLIGVLLVINCLIILCYYLEKRYADFFLALWKDSSEMRYKRSMLHGVHTEAVIERIKELMELENIYQDTTLSLKFLSKALSVTPHQLSEILNTRLGTNFRSLVNTYKISAAKKMILEDGNAKMIQIAYQCGFNSKNAFNSAFQKLEGMTPTEFKDRCKKRVTVYKHGRQN
jgi:AraC-like DNA-binding protein